MNEAQRRHIRRETLIATVLCSLLPTAAAGLLFEPMPVPVAGADGLVGFALKSTAVAVLLMSTLMTLGVRAKLRRGALAPLPRAGWIAALPSRLALRGALLSVTAALVLAAATAALADAMAWPPLSRSAFVAYNLVIGALIGALMTPVIQRSALMPAHA